MAPHLPLPAQLSSSTVLKIFFFKLHNSDIPRTRATPAEDWHTCSVTPEAGTRGPPGRRGTPRPAERGRRGLRRGVWAGNPSSGLRVDVCYTPACAASGRTVAIAEPQFPHIQKGGSGLHLGGHLPRTLKTTRALAPSLPSPFTGQEVGASGQNNNKRSPPKWKRFSTTQ